MALSREVGSGGEQESRKLFESLSSLTDADFNSLRVAKDVPGRQGAHVSATQLIQVVTKSSRENSVRAWSAIKGNHFQTVSHAYSFQHRFPGQRGPLTEVVDIPTALQIIMVLPGKTAAQVRLKASVLLVRYLAGDLSLVGEIYGMNALQEYLRENDPQHPLTTFAHAVEQGQAPPETAVSDLLAEKREELELEQLKRRYEEEREERAAKRRREETEYQERRALEREEYATKRQQEREQYEVKRQQRELEMAAEREKLELDMQQFRQGIEQQDKEKTLRSAEFTQKVLRKVEEGAITAEQAKEILGQKRKVLRLSLTTILERMEFFPRQLPRDFAARFKRAYIVEKFFDGKPSGDIDDRGYVVWFDEDVSRMWDFAKVLEEEHSRVDELQTRLTPRRVREKPTDLQSRF